MLFTTRDALAVDELLREAAAAEILPRFRNLATDAVRQKSSPMDLVTDADEAAEVMITAALGKAFPRAIVIGEEATERNRSLLARLADAELAFVIDPVDGTKNFASGLTLFGVMASVVSRGEVVAGIIHDPVGRDSAIAVRGEGAWIEREGSGRMPLRVAAPPSSVTQASVCASLHFLPPALRSVVTANLSRVGVAACYRCAAHEYRLAAAGHYEFLVYSKLMPWDHAAGWLLHREAGGYSARFDGTPYRPTILDGGLICAPDEASWHALRDALFRE